MPWYSSAFLERDDGSLDAALHPRAGDKVGMQVMREAVELGQHELVAAYQCVVPKHGRNGDSEAQRRHDQRFADRPGHLVDRRLTSRADAHQSVIDAPYRAEQADE